MDLLKNGRFMYDPHPFTFDVRHGYSVKNLSSRHLGGRYECLFTSDYVFERPLTVWLNISDAPMELRDPPRVRKLPVDTDSAAGRSSFASLFSLFFLTCALFSMQRLGINQCLLYSQFFKHPLHARNEEFKEGN